MQKRLKRIIIFLICGGSLLLCILTCKSFIEPFKKYLEAESSFEELTDAIENNYLYNCIWKKNFINLNGLYSRAIGKNELNNVIRLKNGMLTTTDSPRQNMDEKAEKIIKFQKILEDLGIEYVYVQAPDKVDVNNELLPDGYEYYANVNADEITEILANNNINVLDLRKYISNNIENINRYYYKTDHHWNAIGAFEGYKEILEYIENIYDGKDVIDEKLGDIANWNINSKEKCFLGSRGKRVGRYFGGLDDLLWITPNFDTMISCSIPYDNLFYKGDFKKANIRSEYIEEKMDLFDENPYDVYIGTDYPLVQHRNANAPSNLKVLLLKDSYSLPVQSYLSTQFKELDVIDLRYFKECSAVDYVISNKPDLVLMMNTASALVDAPFFEFGDLSEKVKNDNEIHIENLEINQSDENYSYVMPFENLAYSSLYCLKIDEIAVENCDCIQVVVWDRKEEREVLSRIVDVGYYKDNFEWTFVTPPIGEGQIDLLIYPNVRGETQNTSMKIKSAILE